MRVHKLSFTVGGEEAPAGYQLQLPDDLFDEPPVLLEGIALKPISPLALYQMRAGVAERDSFGPPPTDTAPLWPNCENDSFPTARRLSCCRRRNPCPSKPWAGGVGGVAGERERSRVWPSLASCRGSATAPRGRRCGRRARQSSGSLMLRTVTKAVAHSCSSLPVTP
jgi:hypothetical protein